MQTSGYKKSRKTWWRGTLHWGKFPEERLGCCQWSDQGFQRKRYHFHYPEWCQGTSCHCFIRDKRQRYFPEPWYGEWFHLEDQRYFHYSRNTCRYRSFCYKHSRIYPGSIIQPDLHKSEWFRFPSRKKRSFRFPGCAFCKSRCLLCRAYGKSVLVWCWEWGSAVYPDCNCRRCIWAQYSICWLYPFQRTGLFHGIWYRISQWQSHSHRRKYHRWKRRIPATCRHKDFQPLHWQK